jgi:hypothetical protein
MADPAFLVRLPAAHGAGACAPTERAGLHPLSREPCRSRSVPFWSARTSIASDSANTSRIDERSNGLR